MPLLAFCVKRFPRLLGVTEWLMWLYFVDVTLMFGFFAFNIKK